MWPIGQKSGYRKSKMADGRYLEFWKVTVSQPPVEIFLRIFFSSGWDQQWKVDNMSEIDNGSKFKKAAAAILNFVFGQ